MKKLFMIGGTLLFSIVALTGHAQDLGKFKGDIGKKSIMGKEIRIPYTDVISYYGYIKPGAKPDEEKGGKKYYYLYVWIPAVAPELGIRMVSPVPSDMAPKDKDFASASYNENKEDKTSYFDTWITLEKAEMIASIEMAKSGGDKAKWNTIDRNDDCSELPAQPSGSKYNSQMRITSEVSNPLKALTVGLYRVGFTTYKTGDVKGSFIAQIGSPVALPGVKVASSLADLFK